MKKINLTIWLIFLFQVDFGRPLTIVAVVTKGLNFEHYIEYVKKYIVRYRNTPFNWTTVYNNNTNVSQYMSISKMKVKE